MNACPYARVMRRVSPRAIAFPRQGHLGDGYARLHVSFSHYRQYPLRRLLWTTPNPSPIPLTLHRQECYFLTVGKKEVSRGHHELSLLLVSSTVAPYLSIALQHPRRQTLHSMAHVAWPNIRHRRCDRHSHKTQSMRLLFKQLCSCKGDAALPRPALKVTDSVDMNDDSIEHSLHLSLDLICSLCSVPWESYAGFAAPPKKPRIILPS
jgi:hypothetical protein